MFPGASQPTKTRARIYDIDGTLVVDSASLLMRGQLSRLDTAGSNNTRQKTKNFWTRLKAYLIGQDLPVSSVTNLFPDLALKHERHRRFLVLGPTVRTKHSKTSLRGGDGAPSLLLLRSISQGSRGAIFRTYACPCRISRWETAPHIGWQAGVCGASVARARRGQLPAQARPYTKSNEQAWVFRARARARARARG